MIVLICFGCAVPIPEKPLPAKEPLSFRVKEISRPLTDDGHKGTLIQAIEKA